MEISEKHQNLVKVFLVFFIVSCLISIFKAGYSFGQYLFEKGFEKVIIITNTSWIISLKANRDII